MIQQSHTELTAAITHRAHWSAVRAKFSVTMRRLIGISETATRDKLGIQHRHLFSLIPLSSSNHLHYNLILTPLLTSWPPPTPTTPNVKHYQSSHALHPPPPPQPPRVFPPSCLLCLPQLESKCAHGRRSCLQAAALARKTRRRML